MLAVLTGTGLAISAGLNAYIPLLAVGLLMRFTDLIVPPSEWQWLGDDWMLAILTVLLGIEMLADKIPAVDHVNDVIQTVVRPSSGGLVCAVSSSSETVTVSDPSSLLDDHRWIPVVLGFAVALGVHLLKATLRALLNSVTLGIGAPVASALEDVSSVVLALLAIVAPLLVIGFLVLLVVAFVWATRRLRARSVRRSHR